MSKTFSTPSVRRRTLIAAGLSGTFVPAAFALAGAERIPLEDFYRLPTMRNLVLSPDGRHIAAIRDYPVREQGERANIVVVDISTRKPLIITRFTDGDVANLRWANNERLVFSMTDRERGSGEQIGGGLFSIKRDGNEFRQLVERSGNTGGDRRLPSGTSFFGRLREDGKLTDEIIVATATMQARGKFSSRLYRLDVVTGRSSLMTLDAPGEVRDWVVDWDNVPRVAIGAAEDRVVVHLRDGPEAPWRAVFKFQNEAVEHTALPFRFDRQGRLYALAHAGGDNTAIYACDPRTGQLDKEPVVAVKGFDLGRGLRFDPRSGELIGVEYEADRRGTHWIDPRYARMQATIDAALPDRINDLQIPEEGDATTVLVTSSSDRDPGRWFLYDAAAGKLEQIGQSQPWIAPERMRPAQFMRYPARDGLSIPAQLTLPEGKGPFPLVVLHYGGPWTRPFHWRWDPNVQFLASRGYAVFMPAPRASTGFGARLYKAGWKQWGLGMQDDVTDGVQKLIKDGIADPKRVCLAGASYGGYLTMMGLVKEPALFKCGINWVGVTDPSFMFSVGWTDFNRVDSGRYSLPLLIGDPESDAEQFKRTSPVQRAAEIKQPVLLAYGGLDRRVPIVNGERMRDALAPHNKSVEWVVYREEGHGGWRRDTQVDFWSRVERFLAANL